mmetsp:Transcript_100559/g.313448  ORF Transcript_100559/g.313448 Transcript_100559/m.313448 type:complete len:217 (-) Transcript_100559:152-802(-)
MAAPVQTVTSSLMSRSGWRQPWQQWPTSHFCKCRCLTAQPAPRREATAWSSATPSPIISRCMASSMASTGERKDRREPQLPPATGTRCSAGTLRRAAAYSCGRSKAARLRSTGAGLLASFRLGRHPSSRDQPSLSSLGSSAAAASRAGPSERERCSRREAESSGASEAARLRGPGGGPQSLRPGGEGPGDGVRAGGGSRPPPRRWWLLAPRRLQRR